MAKRGDLEHDLRELDRLKDRGVITEEEYQQRRSALLTAGPAPVVVQQKRGGLLRALGVGCAVIVLAGIVFIVLIALIARGGDDDDATAVGPGTQQGDVRIPLAQGSAGTIAPDGNPNKRTRVTILDLRDGATSTNQFAQPPAGKKYYAVQVELENVGTEEVTALTWKFRDTKDVEVDRAFVAGIDPRLDQPNAMTPGAKTSGWVVFTIDADAAPKWLRADPNSILKNDLYFEAQ